jgi:hypothetical protein
VIAGITSTGSHDHDDEFHHAAPLHWHGLSTAAIRAIRDIDPHAPEIKQAAEQAAM